MEDQVVATVAERELARLCPLHQVACPLQRKAQVRHGGVSPEDGQWVLVGFFPWGSGWEFGSGNYGCCANCG